MRHTSVSGVQRKATDWTKLGTRARFVIQPDVKLPFCPASYTRCGHSYLAILRIRVLQLCTSLQNNQYYGFVVILVLVITSSPSYSGQIVFSETLLIDIITTNKVFNKQIYVLQIYVYDFGEDGRPLEYPNNILPEYVIEVEVS